MNILFLYTAPINPESGGVERVTYTLSNYFELNGHKIFFISTSNFLKNNDTRQYYLPSSSFISCRDNKKFFYAFILDKKIDIVINQSGTNPDACSLAYICNDINIPLVSVIHNSPLGPARNLLFSRIVKNIQINQSLLLKFTDSIFLNFIVRQMYRLKYKNHYRLLCKASNIVFLLSESYIKELIFFTGNQFINKVISLGNPTSFDQIKKINKNKELLFVGRVNTYQKNVNLLLIIWSRLHYDYSDWVLNIVGGGEELESMKLLSKQLGLTNVRFHGFADPKPFYQTASIFCMTSSFEGLPMTLIEAMQFGVVPVAFDSFDAVFDIIENDINGYIVDSFSLSKYVDTLKYLMSSGCDLNSISRSAELTAKKFSLDLIGGKWLYYLNEQIKDHRRY